MSDLIYEVKYLNRDNETKTVEVLARNETEVLMYLAFNNKDLSVILSIEEVR